MGGWLRAGSLGLGLAPRVGLSLNFESRALSISAGVQRDQSAVSFRMDSRAWSTP